MCTKAVMSGCRERLAHARGLAALFCTLAIAGCALAAAQSPARSPAASPRAKFLQTLGAIAQPGAGTPKGATVQAPTGGIAHWFGSSTSSPATTSPATAYPPIPPDPGPTSTQTPAPVSPAAASAGQVAAPLPVTPTPPPVTPTPSLSVPNTAPASAPQVPAATQTLPPPTAAPSTDSSSSWPAAVAAMLAQSSGAGAGYPSLPNTGQMAGQTASYPGIDASQSSPYPPLPGTTSAQSTYPPLPGTTSAQSAYPPLPATTSAQSAYPPLPGTTSAQSAYPPLPGTTSTQSAFPPLPGTDPSQNAYPPLSGASPAGSYSGPPGTATAAAALPASTSSLAPSPDLYAGMAFEVHALKPHGKSKVVDPATHAFQTGDRFVLLYRPSMPGRIDVYNVNPHGVQTTIDTAQVAAGQLMTLGPYEFTDTSGSESLRLVLTPCSDSALLAATRDIVKVGGSPAFSGAEASAGGAAAAGSSSLPLCSGPGGVVPTQTRDIRKVQSDQGTAYALDAVTPEEISTGHYATRQITITFNHR